MDLRLNLAEDLLRGSGLSIAQIAYAAGFNSQSHLTTAMRRYRGVTPALYRTES
jgi:AraC family transcriptional regulator